MSETKKLKILIVEDSEDLREMLVFMVESLVNGDVKSAADGKLALDIVQGGFHPDLIVCDYNMPVMNGGQFFIEFRKSSMAPYVLYSSDELTDHKEFEQATNVYALRKPAGPEEFEKLFEKILSKESQQHIAGVGAAGEDEYLSIPVPLIEKMRVVTVPVYLKLSDTHYVKVAHADQSYDQAELNRYKARGQRLLYLKKRDLTGFIRSFQVQMTGILHRPTSMPNEEPIVSSTLTAASLEFLRSVHEELGFNDEVYELTQKNIQGVMELAQQNPLLSQVLELWKGMDVKYADRCTMAALISTSLAKKLNWVSDTTSNKLAFAAVLHDVGLSRDLLWRQDELEDKAHSTTSWAEPPLADFTQHPRKSAEILLKWNSCPSDVDVIVSQHHERPDGRGFPARLPAHRIAPLSSVFIFSLHLARFIAENKGQAGLKDWLAKYRDEFSVGGFRKIIAIIEGA